MVTDTCSESWKQNTLRIELRDGAKPLLVRASRASRAFSELQTLSKATFFPARISNLFVSVADDTDRPEYHKLIRSVAGWKWSLPICDRSRFGVLVPAQPKHTLGKRCLNSLAHPFCSQLLVVHSEMGGFHIHLQLDKNQRVSSVNFARISLSSILSLTK